MNSGGGTEKVKKKMWTELKKVSCQREGALGQEEEEACPRTKCGGKRKLDGAGEASPADAESAAVGPSETKVPTPCRGEAGSESGSEMSRVGSSASTTKEDDGSPPPKMRKMMRTMLTAEQAIEVYKRRPPLVSVRPFCDSSCVSPPYSYGDNSARC